MAIIEVVKWDGAPHILAYKHPNSELSTKTQLIVAESQEAVLVKEGQFYGPFGPGRHVLDTKNYPILTPLMKKFITGGASPFTAEVWFIQKAIPMDNKWGTPDPLLVEDPQYRIAVPLRAFGQFGLQIRNSMTFLGRLVGRLTEFDTGNLARYFKGIIITRVKSCIGNYLSERNISLLQINTHLNEISEYLQNQLVEDGAAYGVEFFSFMVSSISPVPDDPALTKLKEALAKRAEMNIIGFNYQQERTFDTLESAAGNPGNGNIMNAGIGLGVGLGMMNPMNQAISNMTQNMNTVPQPSAEQNPTVCPKCGKHDSADAKFCSGCGSAFFRCPSCNAANQDGAAVCSSCGKAMPVKCEKCGTMISSDMKFCSNCGNTMKKTCPNCGKDVSNERFCSGCGTKID
ncbi:MAG: SPFH domain-containing protein [Lentisphaeria bacterium]|nr:SPFH domain-containing protein [Lentisphaeria bacterium]